MSAYESLKIFGHFGLREALVKNPIFEVKMSIKRNPSIFPYRCKGQGLKVNVHHAFYHPKNWRKNIKTRYVIQETFFDQFELQICAKSA